MRIELRNENRQRIGRVLVDPAQRPTRVSVVKHRSFFLTPTFLPLQQGNGEHSAVEQIAGDEKRISNGAAGEAFLHWDTAVDDSGHLRRCVACGCPDLFREKAFPQVTGFVVLLAFVGAIVGALGLATDLPVLLTLVGVLLLDVAILVFSKRRLVCYRCRSTFHNVGIARYHRPWDRSVAERYPPSPFKAELESTTKPPARPTPMPEEKGYFA